VERTFWRKKNAKMGRKLGIEIAKKHFEELNERQRSRPLQVGRRQHLAMKRRRDQTRTFRPYKALKLEQKRRLTQP
jgi:hypothetical protein